MPWISEPQEDGRVWEVVSQHDPELTAPEFRFCLQQVIAYQSRSGHRLEYAYISLYRREPEMRRSFFGSAESAVFPGTVERVTFRATRIRNGSAAARRVQQDPGAMAENQKDGLAYCEYCDYRRPVFASAIHPIDHRYSKPFANICAPCARQVLPIGEFNKYIFSSRLSIASVIRHRVRAGGESVLRGRFLGLVLAWTKVPSRAEANRMGLAGIFLERPENASLKGRVIRGVHGCSICGYSMVNPGHPLSPWLRSRKSGDDSCDQCRFQRAYRNIMTYRNIVVREYERRLARGLKASKREIAKAMRDLAPSSLIWTSSVSRARFLAEPSASAWAVPNVLRARLSWGYFYTEEAREVLGHVLLCNSCNKFAEACACTQCDSCGRLDSTCTGCDNSTCSCDCERCGSCGNRIGEDVSPCRHEYCNVCHPDCESPGLYATARYTNHPTEKQLEKCKATAEWPRLLGFEIEVAGCKSNATPVMAAVKSMGWNTAQDGSLPSGGIEIRSYPIRGDSVKADLSRLLEVCEKQKVFTTSSCGLHIHVDARDLTSRQLVRTFIAWGSVEARVFEVLAPKRKGNDFCQPIFKSAAKLDGKAILEDPMSAQVLDGRSANPITGAEERIPNNITFKKIKRAAEAVSYSGQDTVEVMIGMDRYRSLNLAAYARHRTLEFRLFEPRLELDYILACAKLATAAIEFGRYGKFTDLPKYAEKTKSKSTRLTYEKLMVWYDDHVAKRSGGEEIIPVKEYMAGVAE